MAVGVIENATGDLLRWQPSGTMDFDSGTESSRTDVPEPPKRRNAPGLTTMDRWDENASQWIVASQPTKIDYITSSKILEGAIVIPSSDWTDVGGVVTTADFFVENLAEAVGRIIGEFQSDGNVDFKLVEVGTGSPNRDMSAVYTVGDTSGAWEKHKFSTNAAPSAGTQTFCLLAKLNGAVTASIRYISLSLLRVYI